MAGIADEPWAEFMERLSQEMIEYGAEEAISITRNKEADRVTTNYHNCDFEKRWILLGHLITDYVLEIIENNADLIRDILEETGDETG